MHRKQNRAAATLCGVPIQVLNLSPRLKCLSVEHIFFMSDSKTFTFSEPVFGMHSSVHLNCKLHMK